MSKPRFSIIIPTLNAGQRIAVTIEALDQQDEKAELILVDAGSRDRTIDVVKRGYRGPVRVYSVAELNVFEMYNRGVSLATGDYVSVLLPADSYISKGTLSHMANFIQDQQWPELAYCGCLIRELDAEPRVLMRPLAQDWLIQGRAPTSLQSCWYRLDALRALGKFDPELRLRGGYDLVCRFAQKEGYRAALTPRVYVDHDRTAYGPKMAFRRALETQKIIGHYYGTHARLRWLSAQHPFRFAHLWWRSKRHF